MTATARIPLLRWSSTRDCPRKAIYEATGAPARDRTVKEDRQLARGRSVGHDYILAIANESRRTVHVCSGPDFMLPHPDLRATSEDDADILAELQVRWELGVGHCDAYIRETDTVLEVLSSQHASPEMIHSKLVQACGYALGLDASSIAVAIVDPATLADERVIVTRTSRQWDDLAAEVKERVDQVLAWRDSGPGALPGRVCAKPGDAWGHFCLHAQHCFDGYEPEPLAVLDGGETHQLVARLYHAKAKEREVKQTLAIVETERKEIEQHLDDVVDPGKFQVGGFQIVKSPRRRESFKLALAKQDSRLPSDLLDEFTTVSEFTVWTVDRNGNAPVDDGPVPF